MLAYLLEWIIYGALVIILALIVLLLLLIVNQKKMIYVPYFPEGSLTNVLTPASFGCRSGPSPNPFTSYELVSLTTQDGVDIQAYWIPLGSIPTQRSAHPPDQAADKRPGENSHPIIVFFHANAGNMGHRLPLAIGLGRSLRCHVYLLSYRGYGHSKGSPSEAGLKLDAQCAMEDIIRRKSSHAELSQSKIILFGQSIGSAVSFYTASKYHDIIDGIIVENAFQSLPRLLPHILPFLSWASFLCYERWDNYKSIEMILKKRKDLPVLFLSGAKDEVVPSGHMQELFEWMMARLCQGTTESETDPLLSSSGTGFNILDTMFSETMEYPTSNGVMNRVSCWRSKDPSLRKQMSIFQEGTHNDTAMQPGYLQTIHSFCSDHRLLNQ